MVPRSPSSYIKKGLFSEIACLLLLGYHLARSPAIMVFPYYLNTEEMTLYMWETFNWCLRSVGPPP